MINELAQWAVLVFLSVFVLGLTRQLGKFLTGKREDMALSSGPDIGSPVTSLFSDADAAELGAAIGTSEKGLGLVFVVDEDCMGCSALLDQLEQLGVPEGLPAAAVARDASDEHLDRFSALGVPGHRLGTRLDEADLRLTPFVIVIDQKLRVVHKALTADPRIALAELRSGRFREQPGERLSDQSLLITRRNGA